jgi:hypothetical protein
MKTGDLKVSMVMISKISKAIIGVKTRLRPAVNLVGIFRIKDTTLSGSFFKNQSPKRHSHSEIVPMGQIQPQKPLLKNKAVKSNVPKMTKPAGWIGLIFPVPKKYFVPISALIGRKDSTPGGLGM